MSFIKRQTQFISNYKYVFLRGTLNTIVISLLGIVFGLIFGTIIALLRLSKNKFLNFISTAYVEIVRGTPMIVQMMIIYFGLKDIIPMELSVLRHPIFLCSLAISLNSAAYVAEVIRGGIQSVEKGQMEGARSLGLTYGQAMREIIIPQAIRNILPALVNEFIALIKESSIVFTVGIADLMYAGKNLYATTFSTRPLYYTALVYLIMTFLLSKGMGALERKLSYDRNN